MNKWLRIEYRFLGRVKVSGAWCYAIIILQPDLELHIFLPGLYRIDRDEEIPEFIEGQLEDWHIRISEGAIAVSSRHHDFDSLNEKIQFNEKEKDIFPQNYYKKLWTEIIFLPKTCAFVKIGSTNIPDEWGLTFYPKKNNNVLFHFFKNNRNPRGLPNVFSTVDRSLYFNNIKQWSFDDIQKYLKLFTSILVFFTGSPISYELLVGRYEKEVSFVQLKNVSNPNAYICAGPYSTCVKLKEESLLTFSTEFVKKVEELYNNPNREKTLILLSYFRILYTTIYDEAKLAFSFQLMESLAKYKNLKFKTKTFDEYIKKALDAIKTEESFDVNPDYIKRIAKKYRNEVFHGSFFEIMTEIDHLVNTLPEGYKRDLPVLLQAIAAMIGVNFILEIDFNQMIAIKREMY
jgi:hypothetical protein